jgi:potassium-transporting ATPase KdpC subunit
VPATDKSGQPQTDAQGKPVYQTNADGTYVCNPNTVPERAIAYRQLNGLAANAPVPVDAVTASGSGLDPDITVANALDQAARIARSRHLDVSRVVALVHQHTDGRAWGILGEKTVNVLDLNLALDRLSRSG